MTPTTTVKQHRRRSSRGRLGFVQRHPRRITVRLYRPGLDPAMDRSMELWKLNPKELRAFVWNLNPRTIYIGRFPSEHPEDVMPVMSHESLHSALFARNEYEGSMALDRRRHKFAESGAAREDTEDTGLFRYFPLRPRKGGDRP